MSGKKEPDDEDRVSIPLPFEEALRGLMKVDPEQIDAKARTLKQIRETPPELRANLDIMTRLRENALRAGASEQEIKETEDLPPLLPR